MFFKIFGHSSSLQYKLAKNYDKQQLHLKKQLLNYQKELRDGELNPGLPRDKRKFQPLNYLGNKTAQARNRTRGSTMATLNFTTKPLALSITSALTQSRTEDRYITSVAPYQLGHKSCYVENSSGNMFEIFCVLT